MSLEAGILGGSAFPPTTLFCPRPPVLRVPVAGTRATSPAPTADFCHRGRGRPPGGAGGGRPCGALLHGGHSCPCLLSASGRDPGEGQEVRARKGLLGDNLSLKGEGENPGCRKAKKEATELKIGALNRMSGNATHSARFDFIVANYLSHILQNKTWEEDTVSRQTNVESEAQSQ